jgi:hypothetical protein
MGKEEVQHQHGQAGEDVEEEGEGGEEVGEEEERCLRAGWCGAVFGMVRGGEEGSRSNEQSADS